LQERVHYQEKLLGIRKAFVWIFDNTLIEDSVDDVHMRIVRKHVGQVELRPVMVFPWEL
jgi:hypothetical protein